MSTVKSFSYSFRSKCRIAILYFVPSKICEELSAKQTPESQQILLFQIRLVMSQKRTVRQRFFNQKVCLFSFSTMPHNDRGYGHGRFAGVFAVAQRQSECGRKTR